MSKNILRSIGAVWPDLSSSALHMAQQMLSLEKIGVLPKGNLHVGTGLILIVIGYRAVTSLIGCYITALLAPNSPMKHALALGMVGVLLSTVGAIATANMNLGPSWYAWTLVAIALPIAWPGGKLYELRSRNSNGK